jgi:hypothetical protein
MLAPGTWANINTQNTAFHRDTLPAFYFVPITGHIGGMIVERFGDIWAGLLLRKAIDHLGDRVLYGKPACDHIRNMHVLLKDLELEFWSVLLTEQLWERLYEAKLGGKSYSAAYDDLAETLRGAKWNKLPHTDGIEAYFAKMADAMHVWAQTTRELGLP